MKTSISFLKSDYNLEKTIELINNSDADYIHVDITDGIFANSKTKLTKKDLELLKNSSKPKDVHLMTLNLEKYIDVFKYINPEYITFQYEATTEPTKIIEYIKKNNIKVGIALNPFTDINVLIPFINSIDLVIIMSVIPGYGGQKFIENTKEKLNNLNELRKDYQADFKISVDGGITDKTINKLNKKALDIVVSGSFVCCSADYNKQIERLKK